MSEAGTFANTDSQSWDRQSSHHSTNSRAKIFISQEGLDCFTGLTAMMD